MIKVIVVLLLLSPVEVPVPRHVSGPWWAALKSLAWDLEISGPDCPWITDFSSEVRWVRLRWREARGFPPISDCLGFPCDPMLRESLALNAAYRNFLQVNWCLHRSRSDLLELRMEETARLRLVWEKVRAAQLEHQNWFCRRKSLAELRDLIGWRAYGAHQLPPCVPLWAFQEE